MSMTLQKITANISFNRAGITNIIERILIRKITKAQQFEYNHPHKNRDTK